MLITNTGIFDTKDIYSRAINNDWPIAKVLTTEDVNETSNLYFTNSRAVSAFTAGKGIVIFENGLIKSIVNPELYNLNTDGAVGYTVTDSMSPAVIFPSSSSLDRYVLKSLHVTNISDADVFISGNVSYASGNSAYIADMIPIPAGGTLEFLKKSQVLQPGDIINLQSFNNSETPAGNIISSIFTYETLTGESDYFGTGIQFNEGNVDSLVYDSTQSYSILESIKVVNLDDNTTKIKIFWADANGIPKAYFSYNLPIPPNSSIELLQASKRIEFQDRVYVNYDSNSNVSVFLSGRIGDIFVIQSIAETVEPGSNITISFSTTEEEGTPLYYSIE